KGKAKPDKDTVRLQKSKLRMEKSGETLNTAKEKLAAQKPIKKPGPVKKAGRAVSGGVQAYVHTKIFQVEDENVGVEGAHRSELVGEAAVRGTSRFVKRRVRSAPSRAVRKAETKNIKATADYQFRKTAQEHPELNQKSAVSRLWQKRRLKKQYQKQAREATKQGAKAAGKTTATAGRAMAGFVKRHPVGAIIALCCVLLLVGLQSCTSSLVTVGNGLVGAVAA
ncbi:MAG: NlpC/P60 family protein, partial [Oscillospiraceae bacterium]